MSRAKGISRVQRTLNELRKLGRPCQVVERRNQFVGPHGISEDLFGIVDVLALDPERGFVGVQVCGSDWQPHVRKMTEEKAQECHDWLSTPGGVLELWGWRKVKKILITGKRGKQAVWRPRIADIILEGEDVVLVERGKKQ